MQREIIWNLFYSFYLHQLFSSSPFIIVSLVKNMIIWSNIQTTENKPKMHLGWDNHKRANFGSFLL